MPSHSPPELSYYQLPRSHETLTSYPLPLSNRLPPPPIRRLHIDRADCGRYHPRGLGSHGRAALYRHHDRCKN